jgi:hypothetical protein
MRSWVTFIILLFAIAVNSQTIQFQTFSASGGSSPAITHPSLISTFGQPIASAMMETNPSLSAGFVSSIIAFSNNFPPVILFTTVPSTISAGVKISPKVTDLDGIKKAMMYYRPIAKVDFDSVQLTAGTNDTYEITVAATQHFDAMGMEYFFKALDNTGRRSVLPSQANGYFHSYKMAEGAAVPASAFNIGDKTSDYRIISIPYVLGSAAIGTQFDELGDHSNTVYRMATYAGNGQWSEYPGTSINLFERGKGYWFLTTKSDATLSLENESTPENFQSELFEMTLKPEWNQIGNPYPVNINWNDVIEYNDNPNIGILKVFSGTYSDGNLLKPYEGAFVKNTGSSPITISIPFQGQTSSGGRKGRKIFSTDLSEDQWMMRLDMVQDSRVSSLAAIGMHPEASDDTDPYDDYYPPRFADFSEVQFPNKKNKNEPLAKDIVPRQEKYTWKFTIEASAVNPVLQWNNENLGSNDIELFLLDEKNSQLIDMRKNKSHAVQQGTSYKIFYGENIRNEIAPDLAAAGKPYPNPWSEAKSGDIKIPFALPGKSVTHTVALDIVDAQGRIARQLYHGDLTSGFYELAWNGEDHSGQNCPSGIYLVRLTLNPRKQSVNMYNRIIITR